MVAQEAWEVRLKVGPAIRKFLLLRPAFPLDKVPRGQLQGGWIKQTNNWVPENFVSEAGAGKITRYDEETRLKRKAQNTGRIR